MPERKPEPRTEVTLKRRTRCGGRWRDAEEKIQVTARQRERLARGGVIDAGGHSHTTEEGR